MQRRWRRFTSIYSDDEIRVLGPWQRIRQYLLGPFAVLLARLGISPDILSFTSVVLSIAFCLLAPVFFSLAFWLLMASILCDGLDGVEARVIGRSTMRGSFTDMFCDQVVVAFSVSGMVWRGSIHPVLAILFVFVYTLLVTFILLHHLLQVSSRWIIRPSRMLLYAAIALYFFFGINLLNALLVFYLLALPVLTLSFWRLRNAL